MKTKAVEGKRQTNAGLTLTDKCGAQRHDWRSSVAVGRSGVRGRLRVHNTLCVADAPKVVVRSIGRRCRRAQIDRLRCALEAPRQAGQGREGWGSVN
jgi:hypothetical protein